jgi:hypothetical protein
MGSASGAHAWYGIFCKLSQRMLHNGKKASRRTKQIPMLEVFSENQ